MSTAIKTRASRKKTGELRKGNRNQSPPLYPLRPRNTGNICIALRLYIGRIAASGRLLQKVRGGPRRFYFLQHEIVVCGW